MAEQGSLSVGQSSRGTYGPRAGLNAGAGDPGALRYTYDESVFSLDDIHAVPISRAF